MKKKKKIIFTISIIFVIALGIFIGILIKNYSDYRNLYNEYYNKFSEVFEFYGEPSYQDGKLKIIDAKCRRGDLALKVKTLEQNGTEVNNYLDFFKDYYNKKEYYDNHLVSREFVNTSKKNQDLTDKLNMGIELYKDTSPELFNNWLDKAVKEYLLKEYDLKPPKGF